MTHDSRLKTKFGGRRLVGQQFAREHIERILSSGRMSHAYLFSGPPGVGKTAFALALAEVINGVDNLTDLGAKKTSKKSSWFTHPDIHLFIPLPTSASTEELRSRLEILNADPYEIVDFSLRPSITEDDRSKNLRAFYPIDYFRENIKPVAYLKPNEGKKTIIILTDIEQMRAEAANAFLKLLEEPSEGLVFLLTSQNTEALLPTIVSRCQHIRLSPLKTGEIEKALTEYEGMSKKEAQYLARIAGGNYAMTRFYDIDSLKTMREEIIGFLRYSYSQDALNITRTAQNWQSGQNIEGQIALLNLMEVFVRDLMIYRDTGIDRLVTNADQLDVIKNFCNTLDEAKLEEIIEEIHKAKPLFFQNVQAKLVFTVLALRFFNLMRGGENTLSSQEPWKHLPAFVE